MRPVGNALGAIGPSLLGYVGCRDALDLRRDDVELRGQLGGDSLEATAPIMPAGLSPWRRASMMTARGFSMNRSAWRRQLSI
jgi:hypothetical protein